MKSKKTFILILLLIVLVGCNNQNNTLEDKDNSNVDMTKINHPTSINQDQSNRAKDSLSKDNNITNIHAVNTEKQLVIAIDISHMKRFRLKKIEEDLKKKMKKQFPRMDVYFSTDKKIILELEKLEQDINSKSLAKKDISKKVKKIIELMSEKT